MRVGVLTGSGTYSLPGFEAAFGSEQVMTAINEGYN